jgi:hypothetical protein
LHQEWRSADEPVDGDEAVLGADVEFKVGVRHASDRGVRRDDPRKGSNTVRIVPPAV